MNMRTIVPCPATNSAIFDRLGRVRAPQPKVVVNRATLREVTGGSPYGASCITGSGAEHRMPTALELDMCRFQGGHVAKITRRLVAGAA